MRINEAYEHEAILPYQTAEDAAAGSNCNCNKISTQCVDVSAPLTLTPTASIGTATVACQGEPSITCVTEPDGTCCVVTLTQKVCVTVPMRYGVTMAAGEPKIGCADGTCHARGY